jgi:hypothetical protein
MALTITSSSYVIPELLSDVFNRTAKLSGRKKIVWQIFFQDSQRF